MFAYLRPQIFPFSSNSQVNFLSVWTLAIWIAKFDLTILWHIGHSRILLLIPLWNVVSCCFKLKDKLIGSLMELNREKVEWKLTVRVQNNFCCNLRNCIWKFFHLRGASSCEYLKACYSEKSFHIARNYSCTYDVVFLCV